MKLFIFLTFISFFSYASEHSCRSEKPRQQFLKETGYPKGRPGYIIDHICPLANGGLDIVENMQWQTVEESRKKDLWENTKLGRKFFCNATNSHEERTVFNCK